MNEPYIYNKLFGRGHQKTVKRLRAAGIAVIAVLGLEAQAMHYGFNAITSNDPSGNNTLIGESQLFFDVSRPTANQVLFHFENIGPHDSSLTHIYFDDQHMVGLLGIAKIAGSSGVHFTRPANPAELSGGATLILPFTTTFDSDGIAFSADSDEPDIYGNGVNSGEWLDVVFNLADSAEFSEIMTALNSTVLRIGIQMQSLEQLSGDGAAGLIQNSLSDPTPEIFAESYVNRARPEPVPDASGTVLLLSTVMIGIESLRRRLQTSF